MTPKASCEKRVTGMIEKIITQERMGEYLSMLARFPQMNFENVLLLLAQLPNATVVCGKSAWRRYHSVVKEGQKPAALLGPVLMMANYEDEEEIENEGEEQDSVIGYDVLPVYDIAQTETSDLTPSFATHDVLAKPLDVILRENYGVKVVDDIGQEYGVNKLRKSIYIEFENTVYLLPGLNSMERTAELLKQYAKICINCKEVTLFTSTMDHYVSIVLAKHFNIAGVGEHIPFSELFEAPQEEKRWFLSELSRVTFECVCELSEKKLLNFNDTGFCNILFNTDNMSDVLAQIGAATEMPDTEDIHEDLNHFLEWTLEKMDEGIFKTIRTKREAQILFTFPPADISLSEIEREIDGKVGNGETKAKTYRRGYEMSM